jgi:hypothetical protein
MSPVSPGVNVVVRPPVNGTTQGVPTSIASSMLFGLLSIQDEEANTLVFSRRLARVSASTGPVNVTHSFSPSVRSLWVIMRPHPDPGYQPPGDFIAGDRHPHALLDAVAAASKRASTVPGSLCGPSVIRSWLKHYVSKGRYLVRLRFRHFSQSLGHLGLPLGRGD